ncbi:anti-sigma factor RsbA family regulatory protein [Planobispora siamensis]|uniref:Anti-sigma regulatory factor n=1 Tax=Planobispora siamensis TaxID=936338 RepID=A0A8J3WJN8_9ACTN|nr:sensor histidine kinase [Planobispora siamensis]GIH91715.1 anti-sigma regulatory factor [Planobispora siamensis]
MTIQPGAGETPPSWDSPAGPFEHPALFYREADDYLAGTLPFIREGLETGEPVAVAVPGENLRLIREGLGAEGAGVKLLDMNEAGRNPGRIISTVLRDFADRHSGGRVRIVGEPVWPGRSPMEYPACLQHEALINLAFSGRDVTILCPYDVKRLDPEVLRDAERTHPVLVDDSGSRASDAYAPEQVAQECNLPLTAPPGVPRMSYGDGFCSDPLARARAFAVEHATRMGLRGDRLEDLRLVVNELAANSLDHGGGSGTLRIWLEEGRVVCAVSDAGHITDPLAGRHPAGLRALGSRGLLITHLLSDLVRMHTDARGTTIRVYFEVTRRDDASPDR